MKPQINGLLLVALDATAMSAARQLKLLVSGCLLTLPLCRSRSRDRIDRGRERPSERDNKERQRDSSSDRKAAAEVKQEAEEEEEQQHQRQGSAGILNGKAKAEVSSRTAVVSATAVFCWSNSTTAPGLSEACSSTSCCGTCNSLLTSDTPANVPDCIRLVKSGSGVPAAVRQSRYPARRGMPHASHALL